MQLNVWMSQFLLSNFSHWLIFLNLFRLTHWVIWNTYRHFRIFCFCRVEISSCPISLSWRFGTDHSYQWRPPKGCLIALVQLNEWMSKGVLLENPFVYFWPLTVFAQSRHLLLYSLTHWVILYTGSIFLSNFEHCSFLFTLGFFFLILSVTLRHCRIFTIITILCILTHWVILHRVTFFTHFRILRFWVIY